MRTAIGSFFYNDMVNKPASTIEDQITLLKRRGMLLKNEDALSLLKEKYKQYLPDEFQETNNS